MQPRRGPTGLMTYSRSDEPVTVEPWTAPFLRLAGSKRSLIPRLLDHVPKQFRRYVEPFAGSACLFFALAPTRRESAILGDRNGDIVNAFSQVRAHPRRLARSVADIPRTPEVYYRWRSTPRSELDSFERAVRFIFLNRHAFNAIYRENRQGKFNVPFGDNTSRIPDERDLVRCSYALRDARLVCDDFEATTAECSDGDFVYLDPPYLSDRASFGEYGYGTYSARDEERLIRTLTELERRGCHFLVSYGDAPSLIEAAKGRWHVERIQRYRQVAASSRARGRAAELLVTNSRALRDSSMGGHAE